MSVGYSYWSMKMSPISRQAAAILSPNLGLERFRIERSAALSLSR
jgi:hypothetical protein